MLAQLWEVLAQVVAAHDAGAFDQVAVDLRHGGRAFDRELVEEGAAVEDLVAL